MRKIASLFLIIATLSTAACARIPAFNSGSTIEPGNSHQTSDRATSGTPSHTQSTGSAGSSEKPGPGSSENPPVVTGPATGDYTNVSHPGLGSASMLAFHEKLNPLTAGQIADCVGHYLPDIFTVSDAQKALIDTVSAGIEGYSMIGEQSSDGGVYQAIFYRESRMEATKSATIWLTGTPAKQSKWEGSESYDICTYTLLRDKESRKQFALFHASLSDNPAAREQEIVCLYTKYACYKDYFPTLLVGDLSGGDNSVLTSGGGLTQRSDDLYTVCMETEVTAVKRGDVPYGTYGCLTPGNTPYKLDTSKKLVALTFDDGPRIDSFEHAYTEAVLNSLSKAGCKATFFIIGNRLGNPDQARLLQQEFAAGHEIGNHTYDHTSYTKLSANELMENLEKTDAKVRLLTGGIPTLVLRAPGGNNKTSAPLTKPLVNWSVDTEDWSSKATPDTVLATFKKQIYAGGIVLMHDLHKNSPDALDAMLNWLAENGYQPVTVSELFEFSGIQMDSDHAYYSASRIKDR